MPPLAVTIGSLRGPAAVDAAGEALAVDASRISYYAD
jgi:hypothetical protein